MRDFRTVEKHNDPIVKKTIVFFIIMIGIFSALSYKTEGVLFGNDRLVPDRNKCIYGIQREPAESIDVLVLGDSLSLSSVSPMSLWKKYGLELPQTEQGPGYGAAMLASVACGEYQDVITCARALTSVKETTVPEPALVKAYEAKYRVWKRIYPAIKGIL